MGASSFTNRLGLPIYTGTDTIDPLNEVNAGNRAADAKAALATDAPIPCTATYDTATKRHTLTPTQTGITLPDIFTARFLATTAFTAGDKVYIGGAEYIPSYTDGDTAVETGVWIANAVVSLDCKKAGLKAYVGAGFGKQLSQGAFEKKPANTVNFDNDITFSGISPYSANGYGTQPPKSPDWMNIVTLRPKATFASQIAFGFDPSGICQNLYYRNRWIDNPEAKWLEWRQVATATPPQEFDLSIAGGHLFYSKNQSGFVTIDVQILNASIVAGIIGTIPTGFAPRRKIKFSVPSDDGTVHRTIDIVFFADGQVHVDSPVKNCTTSISFQNFS